MQVRTLKRSALFLCLTAGALNAQARPASQDSARALITRAANHLGGLAALGGVRTLRMQYVTHWYRPSFEANASGIANAGSLELNVDTRDYTRPAWRQYRGNVVAGATAPAITNIVADTVAITQTPRGPIPLNATYLAERSELFLMAMERLLPALDSLARAGGALALRDTTVGGTRLHGLRAPIDGREVTLWLDDNAFIAGVRVRGAQPWDFGLAGYGTMDVDAWLAQWRMAGGVAFPGHIRILRVGQPYKELFIQSIDVNPAVAADSFSVSDSMRAVFVATSRKAMFDVPIPAVRLDSNGVAAFGPPQVMQGALRLKDGWLVIGAGADSLVMRRAAEALGPARGAVAVTTASLSVAGGAPAADRLGFDIIVPTGAQALVRAAYRQQASTPKRLKQVNAGAWQMIAGDSVWIEPVQVPDFPGASLIWVPRLSYAYLATGPGAMQTRAGLAQLDKRGFRPTRIGTVRALSRAEAEVRREAAGTVRP